MAQIQLLLSVSGTDVNWLPGQIVDVDDETAAKWADGVRAVMADGSEPPTGAAAEAAAARIAELQLQAFTNLAEAFAQAPAKPAPVKKAAPKKPAPAKKPAAPKAPAAEKIAKPAAKKAAPAKKAAAPKKASA